MKDKTVLSQVPIVSVKALAHENWDKEHEIVETANLLLDAAKQWGFIYVTDHGVPSELLQDMEAVSREFFSLPESQKMKIRMDLGGKAWRGYFPGGGELTSGIPDSKEGIYFGSELDQDHPEVKAGTPLHGPNLWPDSSSTLRPIILEYLSRMTKLGHALMRGFAIGLGLKDNYFKDSFGKDPTILFRIFNYPKTDRTEGWGVGEHTDYGFLTILKTDSNPGLQILNPDQVWIDAPPIKDTFIINLGDQLEIATQGLLKATPHRVKHQRDGDRLSWPFFFDPDWRSSLRPVDIQESAVLRQWVEGGGDKSRKAGKRWDGKDLHTQNEFSTYGEYLMNKVSKCFPKLFDSVI